MIRKLTYAAAIMALVASSAQAQERKVEVSASAGWTFSDGVSGNAFRAPDGKTYDRIDPKDSFNFGFGLGYHVTDNWEVEFLYDRQQSKLELNGPSASREIGDMPVATYHGVVSYHLGESDATVRPYFFLGAGATNFTGVSYTALNGQQMSTEGETKFSPTFGMGIKAYPGQNVGLRIQARWTPTYVKSDAAGWWCDPYWGCYMLSSAQYSNQFQFTGGITFRF